MRIEADQKNLARRWLHAHGAEYDQARLAWRWQTVLLRLSSGAQVVRLSRACKQRAPILRSVIHAKDRSRTKSGGATI